MKFSTVWHLAAKDLHLMRRSLVLYGAAGLAAIVLASLDDRSARSLGITLAINVFIAACFHLVLGNVLQERERKTLAFTLSLPVSPREATAGKLLSSLLLYLGSGLPAAFALVFLSPVDVFAAAAHDGRGLVSHALGWLAYFALVLGGFLVFFAGALAVAIVSESLGWTIGILSAAIFVGGNGLLLFGSRLPPLAAYVRDLRHGGPALPATLGIEALAILATLALTFFLQDRKTSFL
jgi:ABC-type Na+ efflux pump permease subunit